MGLVSAKEMLNKAVAGGYAVGHFNINNLEWTKAILQTAQELQSPVITPQIIKIACPPLHWRLCRMRDTNSVRWRRSPAVA